MSHMGAGNCLYQPREGDRLGADALCRSQTCNQGGARQAHLWQKTVYEQVPQFCQQVVRASRLGGYLV